MYWILILILSFIFLLVLAVILKTSKKKKDVTKWAERTKTYTIKTRIKF